MLEKTEVAIKNGQSRETGNIWYTRHKTQDEDKQNEIHNTICVNKRQRIPKGQSRMDNPEKLATLGTQDTKRNTQHNMCKISIGGN